MSTKIQIQWEIGRAVVDIYLLNEENPDQPRAIYRFPTGGHGRAPTLHLNGKEFSPHNKHLLPAGLNLLLALRKAAGDALEDALRKHPEWASRALLHIVACDECVVTWQEGFPYLLLGFGWTQEKLYPLASFLADLEKNAEGFRRILEGSPLDRTLPHMV
jgi:hypothetical protein